MITGPHRVLKHVSIGNGDVEMKKRLVGITVGLSLGTMLMGTMAASASPASVSGSSIKAVVVKKSCTSANGMMVNLSVISVSGDQGSATTLPTRYTWTL